MPLVSSDYNPPLLFKSSHWSTVYSGLIRKVEGVVQKRERIELTDGDFLDLDWSFTSEKSSKVVILLHGLEGHGQRPYITGSSQCFNRHGYDCCAVNFRGCSGETNRLYRSYHSGATEDLDAVMQHIISNTHYLEIIIKGFSLGGNMVLKYLGEGRKIPAELKAVVAVSVPCNLHDSLIQLLKFKNVLYARRFRNHLLAKLQAKRKLFPHLISTADINNIKTLKDFDDIYTSRAHGFRDALDYYEQSSCLQFLPQIKIPVLIINARDDTFLGPPCYPIEQAKKNPYLHLEMPNYGGHVGFFGPQNITYSEKKALNFVDEVL